MPVEITMPQLSDTMTEGTLIKWYKKEGDNVSEGAKLADRETDKAVMEFESFEAGTLARILVKEGEKAQVGQALAIVAGKGEKVEAGAKAPAAAASAAPVAKSTPVGASSHDTELGHGPIEEGRA